MAAFLRPFEGPISEGFRILTGLLFLQHGLQKLFGMFGGSNPADPLLWAAGAIELGAGALVAAGLFTRWAAFFASGTMAAAYFMVHAPQGFWPIENKGELAALYCWAFLLIAARGPGPWSLDALLRRR
jgi:putative oxidoreductase